MMGETRWTPDYLGFLCPYCGTPNPDGGDKCGNCDENPFILPPTDKRLTIVQLKIYRAVVGGG